MNSCIKKKRILAKKGIIDLKNWDFEKDGIIRLDGEWEFYNNKLLNPEEIKIYNKSYIYVNIPGRWRNIKDDKIKIGRYGFVTQLAELYADFVRRGFIGAAADSRPVSLSGGKPPGGLSDLFMQLQHAAHVRRHFEQPFHHPVMPPCT